MHQKRKIPFDILDSIRGIASLYVAIAHARGTLWMGGNEFAKMYPREHWDIGDYLVFGSSMLTRLAVEFVIVFFVLSGFSIAHSLSENKLSLSFYKRRFIRIYPSYLVALIWAGVVFAITAFWHPEWYDGSLQGHAFTRTIEMNSYFEPGIMLRNLVYMPGQGFISPFWSLTYEVIFYLLAPFLLRRVHWYISISLLFFFAYLFIPGITTRLGLHPYIHNFLFVYNVYFAIGVTLYKYLDNVVLFFRNTSPRSFLAILVTITLIMYVVNIYFKTETVYSFIVSAFLGVFLIIYFLKYEIRIRWLMNVGKLSYTLYITHFATIFLYLAVYWWLVGPDVPYISNYAVWIPGVIAVLLVAWLQYILVEKRTKNILNFIRAKNKKTQ